MPSSDTSSIAQQLSAAFAHYDGAPFSIRVPGWSWSSSPASNPVFSLVFPEPNSLNQLLHHPTEVTLGESFIEGEFDIEGDVFSAFDLAEHLFSTEVNLPARAALLARSILLQPFEFLAHIPQHSRTRDRVAISYHYDRPAQFFRPWLGTTMLYSCGYFRSPADDLDQAQISKMDLICRKLDLRAGDSMLDIGCGWGSLVMHAASRYGAQSRGITLSTEQARFAADRIADRDLAQTCSVELQDYRDLPALSSRYDKIASVGMFEHVGRKNLPRYFQTVYQLLEPGGLFLNHGIDRSYSSPSARQSFIRRHVFPDGELVPLCDSLRYAEAAGFEVRDVENLREHYVRTLKIWTERLISNKAAIREIVPDTAFRTWMLYMAGSAVAFQRGDIAIHQVLLARRDRKTTSPPVTRETWYNDPTAPNPPTSAWAPPNGRNPGPGLRSN